MPTATSATPTVHVPQETHRQAIASLLSLCHKASEITPDNDALQYGKIFFEIYFVFKMIVRIFGTRKLQLKLFIL